MFIKSFNLLRQIPDEDYELGKELLKLRGETRHYVYITEHPYFGMSPFGTGVVFWHRFPKTLREAVAARLRASVILYFEELPVAAKYSGHMQQFYIKDMLETRRAEGLLGSSRKPQAYWNLAMNKLRGRVMEDTYVAHLSATLTPKMLSLLYGEGEDQ